MKINLKSNFMLLGDADIDSIEFDSSDITLRELLDTINRGATNSPRFLNRDGTDLNTGWAIEIEGRSFDMCEEGINTILRDGVSVVINIEMLGGG